MDSICFLGLCMFLVCCSALRVLGGGYGGVCLCRASVFVFQSLWVTWKECGGEWGGFYGIVLLFGLLWGEA